MKRWAWLLSAAVWAGLLAGCVERRYVITSDPPGALVQRSGVPIGFTPADDYFTYYGTYHFTLIRDGFEPLQVDQPIPTPWYEYPPLDFVAENLLPWTIYDIHRFHYQMQPVQIPRSDEVLQRGQELRDRSQGIGPLPER
jgi:PEGA domain